MFATPAYAQTAGTAPPNDAQSFLTSPIGSLLPIVAIMILFYFLLIRPQQQRARRHQETVQGVKRGDTVVLSSGVIGKVVRVEDKEGRRFLSHFFVPLERAVP